MWRRMIDMLPWRKDRADAAAAQGRADEALLDAVHRKGKVDATVSSLNHRVFAVNHITEDITRLLLERKP